jgi:hypothetical protein
MLDLISTLNTSDLVFIITLAVIGFGSVIAMAKDNT